MSRTRTRRWLIRLLIWSPVVAVTAAWLISLFGVSWAPQTRRHLFHFASGCLFFEWQRSSMPCVLPPSASRSDVLSLYALPPCSRMTFGGTNKTGIGRQFSAVIFKPGVRIDGFLGSLNFHQVSVETRYEPSTHIHFVVLPIYIPFMITVILPAVSIVMSLRKRKSGNQCSYCDYDLTGNQSGICPECGHQIIAPFVQADCTI